MSDNPPIHPARSGSALGAMLETPLIHACLAASGGSLSPITWFRSEHQRGGGSTGIATLTTPAGEALPAIVKLPVGPVEHRWTLALSADPLAPTPRVYAAGSEIAGSDLAWLVMQRIEGRVLGAVTDHAMITDMLKACALFQARCAAATPLGGTPPALPFDKVIAKSRDVAHLGQLHDAPAWAHALRDVAKRLDTLLTRWNNRQINTWCHGDLHGGNAIRTPDGHIKLIDLALVHPGHWLEDALYLERVNWGRFHAEAHPSSPTTPASAGTNTNGHADPAALLRRPGWAGKQFGDRHAFSHHADHADHRHDKKPDRRADKRAAQSAANQSLLSQLAAFRRELGLPCDDDYGLLANTRRVLMAACAPAWIEREGNPHHLAHALELIERLLPQVA